MSPEEQYAAFKARQAAKAKPKADHRETCNCGAVANWRDEHGTWRCTRHEKQRLAAEGLLPPGITLEE